jgi:putative ATP-binding cassette transporter
VSIASNAEANLSDCVEQADLRLDLRLLKRLARCFLPFWTRRQAWPCWLGMGAILGQTGLVAYLTLASSYLLKDVTNLLVAQQTADYRWSLLCYLSLCLAAFVVPQLANLFSAWISKQWRIWLTRWVTQRYLGNRTYYDIALNGGLDNPDQRIQESLATLVLLFFRLPVTLLAAISSFVAAAAVLGSIDRQLAWVVIVCSLLQIIITYFCYVPLIRLRYAATMAGGNLRYALSHLKNNAEAIAFYRGEGTEFVQITSRIDSWVRRELIVSLFKTLVSETAPLLFGVLWVALPYLLLAPRVFAGELDFGTLTQAIAVSATVTGAAQALLSILSPLAGAAPHAVRIAQVLERADAVEREQRQRDSIQVIRENHSFAIRDLCLETPGGEQRLIAHLSLALGERENLAIIGATGVGKSSLLRALGGLWGRGQGIIQLPPVKDCLFLPQQPYLLEGSLREQLHYPHGGAHGDDDLCAALQAVLLPDLLEQQGGLDAVKDWQVILSLGERQRLAFARILLAKPCLVLLDEATSAVDGPTEKHLYEVLTRAGLRFISVAHRAGVLPHHQRILRLEGNGRWSLSQRDESPSGIFCSPEDHSCTS